MSVSLTTDIQQEGESGPLTETCIRGKTTPQVQGTKDGTGEGPELEDPPQDAQVGFSNGNRTQLHKITALGNPIHITYMYASS